MSPPETGAEPPQRPRAPISLQLVTLLVVSLLAAQAITFAAIMLIPPPRPPVYRVAEIASALRGGSLESRLGRPMTRQAVATLPPGLDEAQPRPTRALAGTLGLDDADVRLAVHPPSSAMRIFYRLRDPRESRMRGDGPRGGRDGPRLERPDGPGPAGFGPWRRGFAPGPDTPIFNDFTAAARLDGGGWVVVRSTPEPFPTDWQKRVFLWLTAGFLVVAPAGYLFARRITAPLKRFAQAAETLGRDPHGPQMTLTGPAEIGSAAQAFNQMQARLKRYIGDRTAMVGAISHDLRTPLARIRFKLEAAPEALRTSVLGDVEQMEQMIGGVLAFIRDESQPGRRERLDLLSAVECVVDDAALLGGDVEIVEPEPEGEAVMVDGDPVALQRLFGNLVQNAVNYGGRARVAVRREGVRAVVESSDNGPGLSPDELEKVFQPFYRTDASRNLDTGGVGLGLPIARSTARAHGGDVELISQSQGLTARVTLPTVR